MNEKIKAIFKNNFLNVLFDEPMKKHTSFKIGGPADIFIDCNGEKEILLAIEICKENDIPWMVVGNGSNLLVSDKGIEGAVLRIGNKMNNIVVSGNIIKAEAGAVLASVANAALKNNLTGLEFAAGIPGNLGGGIYMNAGAYDGELKNVVKSVSYIDEKGNLMKAEESELDFSYRHSMFSGRNCVILGAELELEKGEYDKIKSKMQDLNQRRADKQPLESPSAGSTFKRPEGYFAGKLIQDSGLRGAGFGGAKVSEKHSGFIINTGNATANDVIGLIEHVKKTVFDKFGVELEPEVKVIGRK